jgi:hypothetical protein
MLKGFKNSRSDTSYLTVSACGVSENDKLHHFMHDFPANQRQFYAAFHAGVVKGRVLAVGVELCPMDDIGFRRVESKEIGGRALGKATLRKAEHISRFRRHRMQQAEQAYLARGHKP